MLTGRQSLHEKFQGVIMAMRKTNSFDDGSISVPNRPGAPQGGRGKRQEDGKEHDRTGPLVVRSRLRHPEDCRGRLGPPGPTR